MSTPAPPPGAAADLSDPAPRDIHIAVLAPELVALVHAHERIARQAASTGNTALDIEHQMRAAVLRGVGLRHDVVPT